MDIRLIAIDFDGTLLDHEKRLSAANRAALESCIQHGIVIVPATGRTAAGIPACIREIPGIRYGILSNGAKVEDLIDGTVISEELINWELAYEVLKLLSSYPIAYDPYINGRGKMEARFLDDLAQFGLLPVMQQMIRNTRDTVENVLLYMQENREPVEKINAFIPDSELRQKLWKELNRFEDLTVTSSLAINLEVNAISATKGKGLAKLAEHLGLDLRQTMAFGDGSNDLSMIQNAGIGVAMANGVDVLREHADYITLSNEEDGVAAAISHFLHLPV